MPLIAVLEFAILFQQLDPITQSILASCYPTAQAACN